MRKQFKPRRWQLALGFILVALVFAGATLAVASAASIDWWVSPAAVGKAARRHPWAARWASGPRAVTRDSAPVSGVARQRSTGSFCP